MIEPTVNLGHIITIALALMGFLGGYQVLKITVQQLAKRMDSVDEDIRGLSKTISLIAVQDERLLNLQRSQILQGERIDELVHRLNNIIDRGVAG